MPRHCPAERLHVFEDPLTRLFDRLGRRRRLEQIPRPLNLEHLAKREFPARPLAFLVTAEPHPHGPVLLDLPNLALTFAGKSGNTGGGNGGGNGGDGGGGPTGSGGANGTGGSKNLPDTGSPDGVPTYALIASALVMAGGAALLIIPRRRRGNS